MSQLKGSSKAKLPVALLYRLGQVMLLVFINAILTRALGVEQYGLLSLLLLNCSVFALFTGLGSDAALSYTAAQKNSSLNQAFSLHVLLLAAQLALLLATDAIWFSLYGTHWLYPGKATTGFWLSVVLVAGICLQDRAAALLNSQGFFLKNQRLLFICIFASALLLLVAFCLRLSTPWLYWFLFCGVFALPGLVLTILAARQLKLRFTLSFNRRKVQLFYAYSLVAFAANAVQFLAYRVDLWLVAYFGNRTELGWYALAVRLVQSLWMLPALVAGFLLPRISAEGEGYVAEEMLSLLRVVNVVTIGAAVLAGLLAPLLVGVFFGNAYQPSVRALQLLLPGVALFANATVLASYFAGINRLRVNFFGSLFCLVVVGLLDLLLIPVYGYVGAALASTVGYAATAVYFMLVYRRHTGHGFRDMLVPQRADWAFFRATEKRFFSSRT